MDDLSNALEPWDGIWEPPQGLLNIKQYTAMQILRHGQGIRNNAEAKILKAICHTKGRLSPGQEYWLERLSSEHNRRIEE